jgi:predicted short-subunit dehydrogenase-like oxidoreductase (DUF2520 family)
VKVWRDATGSSPRQPATPARGHEGANGGRVDGAGAGRPSAGAERPAGGSGPERRGHVGRHHHGDMIHAHLESHPHIKGSENAPSVGIVGAGPVGTALGLAIQRAGWPVVAVASRDAARREGFGGLVPGVRAFAEAAAVVDEAELVFLAVPDDAIPVVAESLRLYAGQSLVHTSGLLGAEVLEPARAAGSQIGAFHPMVSFTSDVERSVAAIRSATIALEGDERLVGLLADLADALGAVPVRLPPGTKPAYHAAATLASGGLVALLDAIATLGAVAGLDERGSLAVYGRLVEQTMANARAIGISAALTGPITRGDAGTVEAHLAALRRYAPDAVELYLAAAHRELRLAEERGVLSPEALRRVRAALAKPA